MGLAPARGQALVQVRVLALELELGSAPALARGSEQVPVWGPALAWAPAAVLARVAVAAAVLGASAEVAVPWVRVRARRGSV